MKGYWNQLRPLEKRLVVGVSAVVFIVLNAWFVVPHFSDWSRTQQNIAKAEKTLVLFEKEIAQTNRLQILIDQIQARDAVVPQEEQAPHFASTILSQAAQDGFVPQSTTKILTSTNQNFFELAQTIAVVAKEQQLVDFLFHLGDGDSLIRVRGFNLHPDQPRQMLSANIQLAASYQRKTTARGASSPRSSPPAAKSTTPAAAKPTTPAVTPPPAGSGKQPSFLPMKPGPIKPGMTNKPANQKKQ